MVNKINIDRESARNTLRLLLILLTVIATALALLFGANEIKRMIMERKEEMQLEEAMRAVLHAEYYELIDGARELAQNPMIHSMYGAYNGENLIGYCVRTEAKNGNGETKMLVGVDLNGAVTGIKVLSVDTEAEIKKEISNEEFLSQYIGKEAEFSASEIEASDAAEPAVNVITGGVSTSINAANTARGNE